MRGGLVKIEVHTAVAAALFAICITGIAGPACASSTEYKLDIAEQPLSSALAALARQTGLQIGSLSEALESGGQVGPLKGQYSLQEAMDSLLRKPGLTFSLVNARTVSVHYKEAPDSAGRSTKTASETRPAESHLRLAQATESDTGSPAPRATTAEPATAAAAEVTVTGSRIEQNGMSTPTPVTMVSAAQLQAIKPGPIIEALDVMPQFIGNSSPGNSNLNFATNSGQSFLNMRGLGINRTLVLLDGRRVAPSSRLGATDISILPQTLIERVDVVTGGASAAYGSDAVAGVVNFMLNTKFNGLQFSADGGITSRGDNSNGGGSVAFGFPLGERVHVIGSTEIYNASKIETFSNRDWFQSWGTITSPAFQASGQGPRLLTRPNLVSTRYTDGGLINQPGSALNRLMFLPDGTATPFVNGTVTNIGYGCACQQGGVGYDYETDRGGDGSVYPDFSRSSSFLYASFDISDNWSAYAQGLYGHSVDNYAVVGAAQFSQWQATVYQDNAFLPAGIRDEMVRENLKSFGFSRLASSADIGISRNQTSNNTVSATAGVKGTIGRWKVNGYYQDGQSHSSSYLIDYVRTDRLSLAMDAVTNPANGAITCRSTLFNPGNGCVPIDLFGAGNASPDAMKYVLGNKYGSATVRQKFAEISANGNIADGWGAGPISLAYGASWRRDSLDDYAVPEDGTMFVPQNDPAHGIQGIPPGFVGNPFVYQFSSFPNIAGSYSVSEYFAETLVPLLKGHTLLEQLNLSLAARFANYSGSGGVWAGKAGLDWQLIDSFRLRGTVSRDTRAANLAERFDSQGQGVTVRDPVFNNSNFTASQFSTGNPNVDPEKADTVTIGGVFTPTFLPGFSASVDWYSIDVKDAITQLGAQIIVNNCAAGDPSYCALIQRDPATNFLVFVQNTYLNVAKAKVSGTDAEIDYQHAFTLLGGGPERIVVRAIGSYLDVNSITNQVIGTINYAGQVGATSSSAYALPRFQLNMNVAYSNGPWRGIVQERYVGKNRVDATFVTGRDIDDNSVPSIAYTDLDFAYTAPGSHWAQMESYFHVTNAFDRSPPPVPMWSDLHGTTRGTNQAVYDVLGRRFTLGVKFTF
jgi:iron complex outermembrane recepter protein